MMTKYKLPTLHCNRLLNPVHSVSTCDIYVIDIAAEISNVDFTLKILFSEVWRLSDYVMKVTVSQ